MPFIFLLVLVAIILALQLPKLFVNLIYSKNNAILPTIPGSGENFAKYLLDKLQLTEVTVNESLTDNHYDYSQNKISLSKSIFNTNSITALAIASHKVSNALQYHQKKTSVLVVIALNKLVSAIRIIMLLVFITSLLVAILFGYRYLIIVSLVSIVVPGLLKIIVEIINLPNELDAAYSMSYISLIKNSNLEIAELDQAKQVLLASVFDNLSVAISDMLSMIIFKPRNL